MHLFHTLLGGKATTVDPDKTVPFRISLFWVCAVCIVHFVKQVSVIGFRTFTIVGSFG